MLFDLFAIAVGLKFWNRLLLWMFDVNSIYWNVVWLFFVLLGGFVFVLGIKLLIQNFRKIQAAINSVIGRTVTVTVDRPLGSYHPEHKDMYYPINYGYVEGIMAADGEEQDAYILGVDAAVEKYTGKIIAIVHRNDDVEEKWVVAPEGLNFTKEEIREQIHFQEQYFDSEIVM